VKQKHYIDLHKGATFLYILFLIFINDSNVTNINAYVYLALHGTYGILWILKSNIFPDRQWESKCSVWYGLLIWFGLSLYWVAPYIIITDSIESSNWYIAMCISIYIFGVFFHFTSDMQKFIQLHYNPNNLITDVMFAKIRNINYLGELFIYLGFSLLAMSIIPIVALLSFVIIIWIPNMIRKDKSLSKYQNFEEYKKNTNSLFPFIW
jgi:steroid 5-alpha reductase family enzyme|tara:strand:+ start:132 stop:755 length:624 start_codon:yes stop_codon:yes gene_type:complete